jgi:DNA-binding NtrC family response regulator
LRRLGYRVLLAEDGQDALEVVEAYGGHIDLVVTDVLMPRMMGPELVKILEAKLPGLRVLYISGYTDGHLAHEGMLERGVEFLQKPFSTDEFAARVRTMLSIPEIGPGPITTEA